MGGFKIIENKASTRKNKEKVHDVKDNLHEQTAGVSFADLMKPPPTIAEGGSAELDPVSGSYPISMEKSPRGAGAGQGFGLEASQSRSPKHQPVLTGSQPVGAAQMQQMYEHLEAEKDARAQAAKAAQASLPIDLKQDRLEKRKLYDAEVERIKKQEEQGYAARSFPVANQPHDAAGWDAYDRMLAERYLGTAMAESTSMAGAGTSAAERKQLSYEAL